MQTGFVLAEEATNENYCGQARRRTTERTIAHTTKLCRWERPGVWSRAGTVGQEGVIAPGKETLVCTRREWVTEGKLSSHEERPCFVTWL